MKVILNNKSLFPQWETCMVVTSMNKQWQEDRGKVRQTEKKRKNGSGLSFRYTKWAGRKQADVWSLHTNFTLETVFQKVNCSCQKLNLREDWRSKHCVDETGLTNSPKWIAPIFTSCDLMIRVRHRPLPQCHFHMFFLNSILHLSPQETNHDDITKFQQQRIHFNKTTPALKCFHHVLVAFSFLWAGSIKFHPMIYSSDWRFTEKIKDYINDPQLQPFFPASGLFMPADLSGDARTWNLPGLH